METVKLRPTVEHVWNRVINKIENHNLLTPNAEKVITTWELPQVAHPFPLKPKPHAGQIIAYKELPNGNIKTRIVSAMKDYEGRPVIVIEGKIKNPDGQVLNAYYGVRTVKSNGTEAYMSSENSDEIRQAVNKLFDSNPNAKKLN